MSWSRGWEGNRSQFHNFFFFYREERGQVQLLFFVKIPCDIFLFIPCTIFQIAWKLVSSAGGNWKDPEPRRMPVPEKERW